MILYTFADTFVPKKLFVKQLEKWNIFIFIP